MSLLALTLGCSGLQTYVIFQPPAGQIAFGSNVDRTALTVINPTSSADIGITVGAVATLSHAASGSVRLDVESSQGSGQGFDFATAEPGGSYQRVWFTYQLSLLPGPGHYTFRIQSGPETLATGELEVTGSLEQTATD